MAKRTRRGRGRPPLAAHEPSTPVCVRVPHSVYDTLYHQAIKRQISVSELIRRSIEGQAHRPLPSPNGTP